MWKCNNENQGHSSCMLASFYLCGFCPSWISKLIMCMPFDYRLTLNWSLFWTIYMHWSKFWALTISLETNSIYEKCNCISFSSPFTFIGIYYTSIIFIKYVWGFSILFLAYHVTIFLCAYLVVVSFGSLFTVFNCTTPELS